MEQKLHMLKYLFLSWNKINTGPRAEFFLLRIHYVQSSSFYEKINWYHLNFVNEMGTEVSLRINGKYLFNEIIKK